MAEKIKVVYIMPSMARGGAERFLLDLIAQLDKNLYAVNIILFQDKGVWYEYLQSLGHPIFVLDKKSKIGINNFREIYKIIKELQPDIVHTQLGGDIRGRLAAKFAGVKIILSTEQNVNIGEAWYQRLAKIITSTFVSQVVAISQAVAIDMKRRYFLNANKCQLIIPNGINLIDFPYQPDRTIKTTFLVGAIGRLNQQKGFDLLIKAWTMSKPSDAKLLIAGSGPEKDGLQSQISAAGLDNQIELIGDIVNTAAFYESLNLLVIPSRWEGLGIVALEAGASGVPVLASNADGLVEIINNKNGWQCQKNDIDDLVQKLKVAIETIRYENIKVKQQSLNSLINDKFSIKVVAAAYSDLYLRLYKQSYENSPSK